MKRAAETRREARLALLLLILLALALGLAPARRALQAELMGQAVRRLAALEADFGLRLELADLALEAPATVHLRGLALGPRSQRPAWRVEADWVRLQFSPWELLAGRRSPQRVEAAGLVFQAASEGGLEQLRGLGERVLRAGRGGGGGGTRSGTTAWGPPELLLRDLRLRLERGEAAALEAHAPLLTLLRAPAGTWQGVVELEPSLALGGPQVLALRGEQRGSEWEIRLEPREPLRFALLSAWLGREVALGGLGIGPRGLSLRDLTLGAAGAQGGEPALRLRELRLGPAPGGAGSLKVELLGPELRLELYAQGGSNLAGLETLLPVPAVAVQAEGPQVVAQDGLAGGGGARGPTLGVSLREGKLSLVRFRSAGPPDYLELEGLRAELEPSGERLGITAAWAPGGGRGQLVVEGYVGPGPDLRLRLRPDALDLASLADRTSLGLRAGQVSGDLLLERQRDRYGLRGTLGLRELVFSWPALATGELSGFNSQMDLVLSLEPRARTLSLESLSATLGELELAAWGKVRQRGEALPYELTVAMGPLPCRDIPRSLPRGLTPLLEGLQLDGHATLRVRARGDLASSEEAAIELDGKVDGFRVLRDAGPDLSAFDGPFVHTAFGPEGEPIAVSVDPAVPGFTPYRRISPYLRRAVVSSEDAGFYRHQGLDFGQIEASLERNLKEGRFARGGSTLTQQVVKNLLLSREKTLSRKLQEAYLAYKLEQHLSKNRILEIYLNIIEWGPGVYGARAAAGYYFGKHPGDLSLPEALFLAAIISSPVRFARQARDGQVPEATFARMQRILARMQAMDFVSAAEVARAAGKRPSPIPHLDLPAW